MRTFLLVLVCVAFVFCALCEGTVVDMHSHSTWSDGSDPAHVVVSKARQHEVQLLALTDHDQLKEGSLTAESFKEARDLGVDLHIGTEISCEWTFHFETTSRKQSKVHLLGYFADPKNVPLQEALANVRRSRDKRNKVIESILRDRFKLDITIDDAIAEANGETSTLGRPHFAKALLKKGYVTNILEAFEKYLSDGNLNLDNWALDIKEAIRLVDEAGGVPVLAHPKTLKVTPEELSDELTYLVNVQRVPLRGIECYSSRHSAKEAAIYRSIAERLGLLVTGGSDYHGKNKVDVPIGKFGGGDAVWRHDGPSRFTMLAEAARHSSSSHDRLRAQWETKARKGATAAFVNFISYAILFAVVFGGAKLVHARVKSNQSGTDPFLKFFVSNAFLYRFYIGKQPPGSSFVNASDIEDESLSSSSSSSSSSSLSPSSSPSSSSPDELTAGQKATKLAFCVIGLQVSYVTWGVFQERIMTQTYTHPVYGDSRFVHSEFLVLCNRASALIVATIVLRYQSATGQFAPYYKYSYAAMSNILSSYFQYEALKYVSFPMQVLSKSSKIIFTMLMGKFVSQKVYPRREYVLAGLISLGLVMFKVGDGPGRKHKQSHVSGDDTDIQKEVMFIVGVMCLVGYICCDSFTSTWQNKIFTAHRISPYQMMQAVNACAVPITFVMLLIHGGFFASLTFMSRYPSALTHALMMSLCSAVGQVFIYRTIHGFGAVVFATIMTCRQLFSIMLSIILNNHSYGVVSYCGILCVFIALGSNVHYKWKASSARDAEKRVMREKQQETTTLTQNQNQKPKQGKAKVTVSNGSSGIEPIPLVSRDIDDESVQKKALLQ